MSEVEVTVRLKHLWGVLVAYTLTDSEAEHFLRTPVRIHARNAIAIDGPVCLRCGADLSLISHSCPGITERGIFY